MSQFPPKSNRAKHDGDFPTHTGIIMFGAVEGCCGQDARSDLVTWLDSKCRPEWPHFAANLPCERCYRGSNPPEEQFWQKWGFWAGAWPGPGRNEDSNSGFLFTWARTLSGYPRRIPGEGMGLTGGYITNPHRLPPWRSLCAHPQPRYPRFPYAPDTPAYAQPSSVSSGTP